VEAIEYPNIDETVLGLVGAHLNPLEASVSHNRVNDLSEELLYPREALVLLIKQSHVKGSRWGKHAKQPDDASGYIRIRLNSVPRR